jgi:copper chaperone
VKDTLTLSIEGMHCGACVRRVTQALQGIAGVQVGLVEVGSARVEFSPEHATPSKITAAINEIGFQAHVQK